MHKETKVKWRLLLQCVFWSFQQIWNNISKWNVSFLTELLYFGTAAPFFSYYTVNKVEWRAALTQASTRLLTTVPASVDALGICRLWWCCETATKCKKKGCILHENGELELGVFAQLLIYSSFFYFVIWKSAGVWTGECMARMCVFLNIYSVTLSVMNSVLSHARNVPAVPTHPLTCPTSHYCLGL